MECFFKAFGLNFLSTWDKVLRSKFYIVCFIFLDMEKEEVGGRRIVWHRLFSWVILIGVIWLIWIFFFGYEDCQDKACFDANLLDCDKANFIGGDDMIFRYEIRGNDGDKCVVDVELLQGELNNEDSRKLEGQSMTCMLPEGVVVDPESDIGLCHGLLKEGLQDLVIRKLHTYLVQNLGRLNLEMAGLPEGV